MPLPSKRIHQRTNLLGMQNHKGRECVYLPLGEMNHKPRDELKRLADLLQDVVSRADHTRKKEIEERRLRRLE